MGKTYRVGTLFSLVVLMLVTLGTCDLAKDKEECTNQLVGLSTCLPYVGGQAKTPTQDCCTGLKQVVKDSKKCLCILVKDRNDPNLGIKLNATLALSLPEKCKASDANVSDCPALLHLAPNSPEAKVFTDFAKAAAPTSSTPATSDNPTSKPTSAKDTSHGGKGDRWLAVQMFYGVLLWSFTFHLIF